MTLMRLNALAILCACIVKIIDSYGADIRPMHSEDARLLVRATLFIDPSGFRRCKETFV